MAIQKLRSHGLTKNSAR